ncbi:MAG: AtpZ/AtpI family protein [Dethiobacteria bacterium]|jgi:F0F1-type ATP synthase assembly protein I|nr:AtpZ/AtpI family protein [Bacillota bacterium]HOB29064.1 AtpZ/AtpI family protein [Bacillota bacterium]HPZ41637.1 AtpZ/AtpI family protein [Bacillota bacterium]HQD52310.1 AtpZ/AtpI family protein [Bacillota bacterium]
MAEKKGFMKYVRYTNLALSYGLTMILAIFLGFYGGDWLDRRLGTSPIFMLLGIFLGVGAGFYSLWSELSKLIEINKEKKLEEKKQYEGIVENRRVEEGEKEK